MNYPPSYKGREQAFVKHALLRMYLERLFMIVGQQHAKRICFVDCFAGPWHEGEASLEDTSIAISLKIMHACRRSFKSRNWIPPEFRALFIEKDPAAFTRLENFLASKHFAGIQTDAFRGEFTPLRTQILDWCGEHDFAFFFVDPTGWKDVGVSTLRPLLIRPNSEFLITFMYNFVNRTLPQRNFIEEMQALLGTNIDDIPSDNREQTIVRRYRERLKQVFPPGGGDGWIVFQPILHPQMNRTWYHLVYLTRHPKGVEVFSEVSDKVESIQAQVRREVREVRRSEKTHQTAFPLPGVSEASDMLREQEALEEVREYWLRRLTSQPQRFGLHELADMIEETDWSKAILQMGLRSLIQEGLVINTDAKRARPRNPVNFDQDEHLKRLR